MLSELEKKPIEQVIEAVPLPRKQQMKYKVQLKGQPLHKALYVDEDEIPAQVLADWRAQQLPSKVFEMEEVAELELEPEMPEAMDVDGGEDGKCSLRKASPFYKRTGGALWAFCACGLMFPALELPDCESTRMVLYYLLSLFKNRANFLHGDNTYAYIAFDDMCHLRRMIESKQALHPRLGEFLEQVKTVVDHFHFKSHKGAYCHAHTNPYNHKELKGGANLSVCEQRFKYIAQHKKSFRYMNQARFNFMLAMVVWLDHKARKDGLL